MIVSCSMKGSQSAQTSEGESCVSVSSFIFPQYFSRLRAQQKQLNTSENLHLPSREWKTTILQSIIPKCDYWSHFDQYSHILSHSVSRVKYIEVKDVWVLHYLLVLLVENHTVINNILRSVTYNKTQHRNQIIKKVHDITLESYLKLDIICTSKCINKKKTKTQT